MHPQPQVEAEPRPASSSLKALYEIFYSPSDAYRSLAGKRPWLVPIIAATVVSLLMNIMIISVIGMGTIVRNRLESSPTLAERLGPGGIEEAVRNAENSTGQMAMSYAAAGLGPGIALCIIAGIMLGALMITGANSDYKSVLGACALSTYAVLVAMTLCSALALAVRAGNYEGLNPEELVMLNVGAFLPDTTSKFVRALAGGIDLIGFWGIFMQSVGLAILSERVTMKQALTISIALYVVWTLVRAGFSAMF
jgi:hypothetical protein